MNTTNIVKVSAHEILASGGYPTVEAVAELADGSTGTASVPYGASAGSHEATVLLDLDEHRYHGNGMLKAVASVNQEIQSAVMGLDAEDQRLVDQTMINLDGTENKSRLGGNAILAVSLAVARAAASAKKIPLYQHIIQTFQTNADLSVLPQPMVVVIEGGKHAHETTDLQEFCLSAVGRGSVKENLRQVMETYHQLRIVLQHQNLSTNVGNEGAFAPNGIISNLAPLQYMSQAVVEAGYELGRDISFSIDAAASEFYTPDHKYDLKLEKAQLSAQELTAYYEKLLQQFPIVTVEDMFAEDDWAAWTNFLPIVKKYGADLIGDDLTVTNPKRLKLAIEQQAISSILIKLNQIGSLTETVECCLLAKANGMSSVTSHRGGGETNDTAMVDLAVAVGSRFVKVGPTRGERVCKYNRLMEIERELSSH